MHERGRRAALPHMRLAAALALLPLLWGCALLPHSGPRPVTEPTLLSSAADSTQTFSSAAPLAPRAPEETAKASAVPAVAPADPPSALPTASADPRPEGPEDLVPQITVLLSEEERLRLVAQADEELRLTQERLDQVDVARMPPDASDRLAAVRELLGEADEARGRGDIRAAARLTRKARILAEDLPRR